jgi:hypothetical protein
MSEYINLYGSIGYTFLQSEIIYPKYILILSDNHSKLEYCSNYVMISEWLKSKMHTNHILLEEVDRTGKRFEELFSNSDHTQNLKKLFINNPKLIHAIDIRPLLIPFSWEILSKFTYDISLSSYLEKLDMYFDSRKKDTDKKFQIHFRIIKNKYLNFKIKYSSYFDKNLTYIFTHKLFILEELNETLDNVMEYNIVLTIYNLAVNRKNVIIHIGLLHAERITFWLNKLYSYKIIEEKGITKISDIGNISDPEKISDPTKIIDPEKISDPTKIIDPEKIIDPTKIIDPENITNVLYITENNNGCIQLSQMINRQL